MYSTRVHEVLIRSRQCPVDCIPNRLTCSSARRGPSSGETVSGLLQGRYMFEIGVAAVDRLLVLAVSVRCASAKSGSLAKQIDI